MKAIEGYMNMFEVRHLCMMKIPFKIIYFDKIKREKIPFKIIYFDKIKREYLIEIKNVGSK